MTEIARHLEGDKADKNLIQFLEILQREKLRIEKEIKTGLSADQFNSSKQRIDALECAQLIIKSMYIFMMN